MGKAGLLEFQFQWVVYPELGVITHLFDYTHQLARERRLFLGQDFFEQFVFPPDK